MFARCPLLLTLLVGGICLFFQSATQAAEPAAAGKTYQVEADNSRVFVKVGSATAFGHPHGVEGRLKSGKLTPGGEGELTFDMGSFTADTPESRKRAGLGGEKESAADAKKVTDTLRGKDVLDAARFPTATFQITAMTPLDRQAAGAPGNYQMEGRFTMHGTAKPLRFKAKLEAAQRPGQMKLTGAFTIKQSDYGIKPYSTFGGAARVSDELQIMGDLLLIPPAG